MYTYTNYKNMLCKPIKVLSYTKSNEYLRYCHSGYLIRRGKYDTNNLCLLKNKLKHSYQ